MAGTKNSGRPGGNPDIKLYGFTTEREESCTALLAIKIPPSQLKALKNLPNWQEKVRESIKALIDS
jgi:hypothetical protein